MKYRKNDPANDAKYIEDILGFIGEVEAFAKNQEGFFSEVAFNRALRSSLQMAMGTTQKLSQQLKEKHPEIDWKELAAFRNVLTHNYDNIDYDIIRNYIRDEMPLLKGILQRELKNTKSRTD